MPQWEQIRHIYSFSHEQQWQQQSAAMLNFPLEKTSEPPWSEGEDAELALATRHPAPLSTTGGK